MHLVHHAGTALYAPDMELVRAGYDAQTDAFPFWAKVWSSSIAMAGLLQENPELVAGKTVLELAAGLGLPSIVAAAHAGKVTCSDLFAEPLVFVTETARHHGLTNIECRVIDICNIPESIHPDIILLSDINYDEALLPELLKSLNWQLEQGCTLLLATPQRIVARSFISSLLPFCTTKAEKQVGNDPVHLFVLQHPV